jgi:transcriptional regulator with XRE-family HTH domain
VITGTQLRQARTLRGLSREELATLLGVSLKTVGNWERGNVPPEREALVREKLFTESPLSGISNQDLVNELLRRLPPEWFDTWEPPQRMNHIG